MLIKTSAVKEAFFTSIQGAWMKKIRKEEVFTGHPGMQQMLGKHWVLASNLMCWYHCINSVSDGKEAPKNEVTDLKS